MKEINEVDNHSWLLQAKTGSEEVAAYYDDWAENYNEDLKNWEYLAPAKAAKLIEIHVPKTGKILDAGCGTGLTGNALKNIGYKNIIGIDISEKCLSIAQQTGAYVKLSQQDLQKTPFPFNKEEFEAVSCIGVLANIKDVKILFKEFCRILRPNGYIVFSHREDLAKKSAYLDMLKEFEDKAIWKNLLVSEPEPYLPKNENYTDDIRVIYYVFQTL